MVLYVFMSSFLAALECFPLNCPIFMPPIHLQVNRDLDPDEHLGFCRVLSSLGPGQVEMSWC